MRLQDSQEYKDWIGKDFETAVEHKDYGDGKMAIVATYDTREEAQAGHDEWVAKMTADILPDTLKDVGLSGVGQLAQIVGVDCDKRRNAEVG